MKNSILSLYYYKQKKLELHPSSTPTSIFTLLILNFIYKEKNKVFDMPTFISLSCCFELI
jgi:hypothetical protein